VPSRLDPALPIRHVTGTKVVAVRGAELEIRDDLVVLTAAKRTHHDHLITGSHIEIGATGIRLRPWRLCYAAPDELDAFAAKVGLGLTTRNGGWRAEPYDGDSTTHVSVYRK